jgi:hypothetical protein
MWLFDNGIERFRQERCTQTVPISNKSVKSHWVNIGDVQRPPGRVQGAQPQTRGGRRLKHCLAVTCDCV